jgi:hypothetical protein
MYYILPTRAFAMQLYENSKDYTEDKGLIELSKLGCVETVITIVEEQIFNRLHWTDRTPLLSLDTTLFKYLPWWESLATSDLASEYYSAVLDTLEIRISELIDEIVGECNSKKMWMLWYTQRLGDDLIVESGVDYRIAELERTLLNESIGEDDV